MEPLEPRQLLSVSLDANGWTVAAPSPGARVIYVSSSSGGDSNPGSSPAAPVKSLHHAESLLQNGSADEMLLECGNIWNESLGVWTVSGRSAVDPIVVGSYGSGARPLLETGAQDGVILGMTSSPQINYVDFIVWISPPTRAIRVPPISPAPPPTPGAMAFTWPPGPPV